MNARDEERGGSCCLTLGRRKRARSFRIYIGCCCVMNRKVAEKSTERRHQALNYQGFDMDFSRACVWALRTIVKVLRRTLVGLGE